MTSLPQCLLRSRVSVPSLATCCGLRRRERRYPVERRGWHRRGADPAIGDAALGDEAPEDLFQDLLTASVEDAWLVVVNIAARAGGDPGYPGLQGPADRAVADAIG
jgi:hypothetical protein